MAEGSNRFFMKRQLLQTGLLLISLFISLSISAAERFWINGSGNWSDTQHWSDIRGGEGGATVPGPADDIYFDNNSFQDNNSVVTIDRNAECRSLLWNSSISAILRSEKNISITIGGSLFLLNGLSNQFAGSFSFVSSENNIIICRVPLYSDLSFSGSGTWLSLIHI